MENEKKIVAEKRIKSFVDRDKLRSLCERHGWYGATEDECDAIMSLIGDDLSHDVPIAARTIVDRSDKLKRRDGFNTYIAVANEATVDREVEYSYDANKLWYSIVWVFQDFGSPDDGECHRDEAHTREEALAMAAKIEEAGHYVQQIDEYHGHGNKSETIYRGQPYVPHWKANRLEV